MTEISFQAVKISYNDNLWPNYGGWDWHQRMEWNQIVPNKLRLLFHAKYDMGDSQNHKKELSKKYW